MNGLDTTGRAFGRPDCLSKTDWIWRFPPMQKTSGFGIRISGRLGWRISAGFHGAARDGFLHRGNFRPDRLMNRLSNPACAHTCSATSVTGSEADMEYNLPLNSPINLDALDDYLMSERAPDDSMGLSDLDGFLTGVIVGPESILPSEWLPVIWGGGEPEFETEEEMRIVLGTIMGRYNEIAACFDSDPDEFGPIFWEGPDGEVIASDWAGGFLDAVALRAQAWRPLIEDDLAGILLAPLFLLNGDIEFDDGAAVEDELLAEASDMIPTCIVGIHEFWRSFRRPPSSRGPSSARGNDR